MTELQKIVEEAANAEPGDMQATMTAHIAVTYFNIRAMACHCECLGMNGENCAAACADRTPPYQDVHYMQTMQKWGLITEKGEPIV